MREGLRRLGNVRVQFWVCPVRGHSNSRTWPDGPAQTVEWRKGIAYCLKPGCWRTSADPKDSRSDLRVIADDGRRWWLLGAESWTGTHLYAARNSRSALAAYRRDITDAGRANGHTVRDVRYLVQASHLRVAAGPLTTVEAFQYQLARSYADAIEQFSDHIIEVACPAIPMTAVDLAERLDPAKAAMIRREVAASYLPKEPARRYVPVSLTASLTRGEYRHLRSGGVRACCLDCGQLVDADTIDQIPEHGCIPTPDPDLT